MKQRRKHFIAAAAGTLATISVARGPARAAEFNFKLGHDKRADEPMGLRSAEAARRIKTESGGRVEITLFPANALGTDTATLSQVRANAVQMMIVSDGVIGNIVPIAAMENVAFAFANYKQAYDAMDGPFGANIRASIAAAGIIALDKVWVSGFKQIGTSTHPIVVPDDLRGQKIRVPPSPIEVAVMNAFGASAVPINSAELYTALQTRVVDGAALPFVTIEVQKFFEVLKYISETNHIFTAYSTILNLDAWQSLPPDLQEIVERNFNAAAIAQRSDTAILDTKMIATLQSQGLLINRPDLAPFRAAVHRAGLYAQWREKFGVTAWTLLEKSIGSTLN